MSVIFEVQLSVCAQARGSYEAIWLGVAPKLVSVRSSRRDDLNVGGLEDFFLHIAKVHGWLGDEDEFLIYIKG